MLDLKLEHPGILTDLLSPARNRTLKSEAEDLGERLTAIKKSPTLTRVGG
ncbi:hypothetical protein HNQ10_003918 [Deinococcus metallilatus]|uniref:Uncharacterized protein n=1 Tax=Deinococcus metallilatus TaxID=1211322 RepID=A0ABR6MYM9_9DEIO|nr:hypothetical protein [Deinococcus metallilatus]